MTTQQYSFSKDELSQLITLSVTHAIGPLQEENRKAQEENRKAREENRKAQEENRKAQEENRKAQEENLKAFAEIKNELQNVKRDLGILKKGQVLLSNGIKFDLTADGDYEIKEENKLAVEEAGEEMIAVTTEKEWASMKTKTCKKYQNSQVYKNNVAYAKVAREGLQNECGRYVQSICKKVFGVHVDKHYANPSVIRFVNKVMEVFANDIMPQRQRWYDSGDSE